MPRRAPTATTTFRLTALDRRVLGALEEELGCSKTDIVRLGLAALRRDPNLRRQLRADRFAAAFLARLRDQHGRHAQVQVTLATDKPARPRWLMSRVADGQPVDPADVQVEVRHEEDIFVVDLVDGHTGVGIRNAWWTDSESDACIPLVGINFWQTARIDDPIVVTLPDQRQAVEIEQDDGSVKRYVLGSDGTMSLLHDEQRAEWFWESGESSP
jgi:hypothetical protein